MKEFKKIKEGNTSILVPKQKKISKKLPVFYNSVMEYNRSITISLLKATKKQYNQTYNQTAFPLGGTAVRPIRLLKECNCIKKAYINDYDKNAIKIIKKNISENKVKSKTIISNKDANTFFLESKGFDYIDIDPFGSPNPFLNNAIIRLSRNSVLAVTATDTGALCGTYPKVCKRKYWANPLHSEEMHEIGLRILIRKIQLIGMQFEKALEPLLCFDKDHYMRCFFICRKGKKRCDDIVSQHKHYKNAGPLWTGKLKNKNITNNLDLDDKFTLTLKNELDMLGFFHIPSIYKKEKLKKGKKITDIIENIKKRKYKASRTHFSDEGIKTNIPYDKLIKILKI